MKKTVTTLLAAALCVALAGSALAQQTIGGHNETSEAAPGNWFTGLPTPGSVAPGLTSSHLLLTEFIVAGTPIEMIEVHNPTTQDVDLSKYYLTDAWFVPAGGTPQGYHLLPTGTFALGSNTDFVVKFPDGAFIQPGGTIVIGLYGPGVDSTFGAGTVDYEVTSVSPTIPDMVNVGGLNVTANSTTLTNGSEFVMLFYWDGESDNVCDVDYVTWGTSSGTSRVDKTGIAVDGPDADAIATPYNADTAIALQVSAGAPGSGSASNREGGEGVEAANGNGCVSGGPTDARSSTWGKVKTRYR